MYPKEAERALAIAAQTRSGFASIDLAQLKVVDVAENEDGFEDSSNRFNLFECGVKGVLLRVGVANCFVEGRAHCVDDPDRNWLP